MVSEDYLGMPMSCIRSDALISYLPLLQPYEDPDPKTSLMKEW